MKTINLLPKIRQQELRFESLLHSLWVIVSLSLGSFALVFLFQFGVKFYLQAQSRNISQEITALQNHVNKQQDDEIKTQVEQANNTITDFKNLAAAAPKWSKVFIAFAPLPPAGVEINSLYIDPVAKSITISGFSPTRELVIQLYNNILNDPKDFYNVDYPLDNLTNATNVNFHFMFYIQNGLIQ